MRTRANALVVVAIIVLGGGLVVLVAAKARESARQIQCVNNLRQIGLGLRDYAEFYRHFPPGTIANAALPPERRLSWYVAAWGFVGQGQTRLLVDTEQAWDAEE